MRRRKSSFGGSAAGLYGGYNGQDFENACRRDLGACDGRGHRSANDAGFGGRLGRWWVSWRRVLRRWLAWRWLGGPWRVAWWLLARRYLVWRLVGPGGRCGRANRRSDRQLPLLG